VQLNRLLNFSASVANSGLNLLLVLIIARTAHTQVFADFTAGVVYGGPFAVLLAFGNDTILGRTFSHRPGFAGLVSSVRICAFAIALALILFLHSLPAAAGCAYVAGAAVQQRFYFEARNNQIVVNSVGIAEKFASIAGVLFWSRSGDSGWDLVFWWIVLTKLCTGVFVSIPIIIKDKKVFSRDIFLDSIQLCIGALPFLLGYVAIQSPALLLVHSASAAAVADFGTASQVGSGLVAALTLWQRPAVYRYIRNEISIRRELVFSTALASSAALIVYVGIIEFGANFKLLPEGSVIHGFILLALVTAVLHPFEVRGYANGRIGGRGLALAAVIVMLVAVPLIRVCGLWAVPLTAIQYQLVVFLYHRLWAVRDRPNQYLTPKLGS
jgi:hypothetical protein